ncbi:MAG: hypothetical protein M0R70_14755 [Nitrospirae bacterium]|nr:hypothetical protein [Nitrospirota bacterium]
MTTKHYTKLVHEREYVAEVDVDLIYSDDGWSPYLSVEDAYKLDDVREALRKGDLKTASRLAKIYTLTPLSA